MPSNYGANLSMNLPYHTPSVISSSSSSTSHTAPFQHGGTVVETSLTPRLTQGDRMTCIVNSSITCINASAVSSSSPSSAQDLRRPGGLQRGQSGSNYSQDSNDGGSTTPSSRSRTGSSQGFYSNRQDENSPSNNSRRERHAADRLRLYAFGGFHQYTDAVNNDLYRLDLDTMLWEKLIYTKGEPPSKRNDHTATLWGDDRIVIFGGNDEQNNYCNDVHVLHVRTLTWETPKVTGNIPLGRVKHGATIENDMLFVSGGVLGNQDGVSPSLLKLDLMTWEWQEPVPFVPRYTHTLFAYRDKLFAYGGYNEEMDRTDEIAYIDLENYQVTKVNISNEIAPNVAAQQFSQVCGRHLVVVISQGLRYELQKFTGGIWTLDLDCFQWTKHDDWKILGENHTWHYFSMERDSDHFYLIGDVNDSDEYFKQVLTVDLREYGTFQDPPVTIGNELGRLLQDQMALADFRIFCTGTDDSINHATTMAYSDTADDGDMVLDNEPMVPGSGYRRGRRSSPSSSRTSSPQPEPILCHKLILMARWPHFASMVQSGMQESQTNTLTLPEPYETVKSFIDYLYTDSIAGMSTDTVADLMVMGSMYVIKRLVLLCVLTLHQHIDIETVSRIYHRAGLSGQTGLRQKALKFMFRNYGPVSKTVGFRSLPKEALLDFWDSTPDGAVINSTPNIQQQQLQASMSIPQELVLFNKGSDSFVDEDYEEALSYYTQSIEINSSHVEVFLKRSTTYQKLGKEQEAYNDAVKALELVKEKPSADVTVEAKAQLRKGVAAFHLHDYHTAKVALEACQVLSPEQRTLDSWIRKNEQELAKLPKAAPVTQTATPATTANATPVTSPVVAQAPALATAPAAPSTPAAVRVRHEWYQNDGFVTISVFIKNVKKEAADINITENALSVSVKMPTGSDYNLELDPLSHKVIPGESKFEILSTKIEIQLKKERFAVKWGALEGDDTNAGSMASASAGAAPAYPSSSKKAKNWDALEKEAAKDEDKADGDKALNQLFATIYKDADDDTKRAMMKSFTESNGTCLSTNWDEVGKGTVETRPPEGMIAKKYNV
ncbi:hypothetical protein BGZ83_000662 [Gryganskiella cystojenkinii]|nr:hypothetical protein BGZ83_000662 [Gryganskiella cystojenkinii]